jgi:hypothetical protein
MKLILGLVVSGVDYSGILLGLLLEKLMDLVIMAIHVILSLLDQLIVNSLQTGGFFLQGFQIFNR